MRVNGDVLPYAVAFAVVVLFGVLAGVVVAGQQSEPPEPLELKLIGDTECAPGWIQIGEVERGVTVWYRTQTGATFLNWISWDRFTAHFHGTEPVVLDGVSPRTRITCRWNPMGGDPV